MRWLAVFILALSGLPAAPYEFIRVPPITWAPGGIAMFLQLDDTKLVRPLRDGSESWNAVAAEALAIWNTHLSENQFTWQPGTGRGRDGNGRNEVFFSPSAYGHRFGWNVLAITTGWRVGAERVEADTIFNTAIEWDSYRGESERNVVDLRRVALHEFGHTLGLDHPDRHGQVVVAMMNSRVSDLDDLADDDVRGARALYPQRGERFSLSVSVHSPEAGQVLVNPFAPGLSYLPGTPVSLTARPNRRFRFNFWSGDAERAGRTLRLRMNEDREVTANFSTNSAPRILIHPRSRFAAKGDTVVLRVRASGTPPLSYQWQFNGMDIPAATNSALAIAGVTHADSGTYAALVTSRKGATPSKPARLIVDGY